MSRRSLPVLDRIVERMARLSAPRHRELVRGMLSELQSIADPAERRRFALGATAAIIRLALSGHGAATVHALGRFVGVPEPEDVANCGGSSMPKLTPSQLLRRHAVPFGVAFASMTGLLLANDALRRIPQLSARGASHGTIVEVLLLALPHTMALTIPMALFLAVSWVFTRLGAEGVLAAAQRERHGVRRLVAPVVGAAAILAALLLVSNTQVLPRANAQLAAVLMNAPREPGEREMTIGELREAARIARSDIAPGAGARAAAYEVEIQKKVAIPAACVILALAGAVIGLTFPRRGMGLVLGASAVVFTGYYFSLVAGESLADQQRISPFVAMWTANALLLVIVGLLRWRMCSPGDADRGESLAIGG